MPISEQELKQVALKGGYRPEILEKVYRLLDLIETLMSIPFLKERLALKGGTAINLFCTENLPRLSVDLDFNYIGNADREIMKAERIKLESIILDVCQRQGYQIHRNPTAHAGGKMVLIYQSSLGNKGRLELDLNYLFRVPLWHCEKRTSPHWLKKTEVTVLDIHELAAGKLHALLGREASRDLFDSHQLLTKWPLNKEKLRLAFTLYAGMQDRDWKKIHIENIQFSVKDIRDKLMPVLRKAEAPSYDWKNLKAWADNLIKETKQALSMVLPFHQPEIEFLDLLQNQGVIRPEIISDDAMLCEQMKRHPLLLWRAKDRKNKNLD